MPEAAARLNQLLAEADAELLNAKSAQHFATYLALLQKWNAKTNLTAIRDEEGILSRHFLESILCARALPAAIQTLLDFGSGAGFPGLPIAILHPQISVTLAESQHKKSAFLREVLRTLDLPNAAVHPGRAETLTTRFDCITLRAVDNMAAAIPAAIPLLAPAGYLAILTTTPDLPKIQPLLAQSNSGHPFPESQFTTHPLPPGTDRILLLAQMNPST